MSTPVETFPAGGLDRLLGAPSFERDPATAALRDAMGVRTVCAAREFVRSLRLVLEKEATGTWHAVLKSTGRAGGKTFATQLDETLSQQGQSGLSALPLEACLVLLERHFAAQGWGQLKLDLADAAEHGLVIARLENSGFAEALADVADFVDPLPAGVLQGFFEHISGQALGCEEIACVRRGAPRCVFVITAPERLEAARLSFGRESAEAIVARLKA